MRVLIALSLLGSSLLGGCYQVDEPVCAYACAAGSDPGAQACPTHYECRADRYCHKKGSTAACEYSDASVGPADASVVVDMSMPDQNQSIDLTLVDGASNDCA